MFDGFYVVEGIETFIILPAASFCRLFAQQNRNRKKVLQCSGTLWTRRKSYD
jgi:hypothetical protein